MTQTETEKQNVFTQIFLVIFHCWGQQKGSARKTTSFFQQQNFWFRCMETNWNFCQTMTSGPMMKAPVNHTCNSEDSYRWPHWLYSLHRQQPIATQQRPTYYVTTFREAFSNCVICRSRKSNKGRFSSENTVHPGERCEKKNNNFSAVLFSNQNENQWKLTWWTNTSWPPSCGVIKP